MNWLSVMLLVWSGTIALSVGATAWIIWRGSRDHRETHLGTSRPVFLEAAQPSE